MPSDIRSRQYIAAGIRALWAEPSLGPIEVMWRFAFGAAAIALATFAVAQSMQAVKVSEADMLALSSGVLMLMANTAVELLREWAPQLAKAALIFAPGATVLWMIAASVGRYATLARLFPEGSISGRAVLISNLLRVMLFYLTLGLFVAVPVAAAFLSVREDESVNYLLHLGITLPLWALIVTAWSVMNWWFSLVPLVATQQHVSTSLALNISWHEIRQRRVTFFEIAGAFGLMRVAVFIVLLGLSAIPASLADAFGRTGAVVLLAILLLIYLVIADVLYAARMAAFKLAFDDAAAEPEIAPEPLGLWTEVHHESDVSGGESTQTVG